LNLKVPTGLQRRSIVESQARINLWTGAVRSGKTIACIIRWLDFIARGPQGDLMMVGKTERTLKRTTLDPIAEIVGDDQCRVNWGMGEARILGRRVYLLGANDQRAEEKLRGVTLAGAYGDEMTTWFADFFGMLLSRLSLAGAKFFGTTNPDSPSHWLKRDWLDRASELSLAHFHFTIDDNPNLDPTTVADLKREFVGVWYQRYILGLWIEAAGRIYDEWDRSKFVVPEVPQLYRRWLGIDFGRYNPFVAQLHGLGEDGRVYVAAEFRYDGRKMKRQKSEPEYVKDLIQWLTAQGIQSHDESWPEWLFVDPSAASFMVELYRSEVSGVTAANNDVDKGLQLVASALATDRLRVHGSCKGLLDEFPTYSWDPKAADRGIEQPLKKGDHSLDALRYGLMGSRHIWQQAPLLPQGHHIA
jgi:PBSX family phage terminase large subunit